MLKNYLRVAFRNLAAAGALLLTIFTVSYQAVRAGLASPVKSLKME